MASLMFWQRNKEVAGSYEIKDTVSEFNEFEPRLKSEKTGFN